MTKNALWLTAALAFLSSLVWADSVQIGRYSEVSTLPSEQQLNPIKTIASFDFPGNVTRVGEAIVVVLAKSGFRLLPSTNPHHNVLFNFSLPAVHRQMGPMSIENILKALAGPAYQVVVDQRFRTVSFRFPPTQTTPEELAVEDGDHWFLADHNDSSFAEAGESFAQISHQDSMVTGYTSTSDEPEKSNVTAYFVAAGDTLSSIGKNLGANDLSHFIGTVYQRNIHAFYNRNKDDLKIASVLYIAQEALL